MFILYRGKWVYRKWPLRGLLHALSGKWVFSVGARKWLLSYLVNCCFEPSQPLGIISWLKETFIKRYIVERTNKAEIRQKKNRVRKRRVVGRIYGMKYS